MPDFRYSGDQPMELEGRLVHPGDVWEFDASAAPPSNPPWVPVQTEATGSGEAAAPPAATTPPPAETPAAPAAGTKSEGTEKK